jgi:SAM-dependent methyltransferase
MTEAANDDVAGELGELLGRRLRAHEVVSDEAFDLLLGETPRRRSRSYWSSVKACQVAAQLFREAGASRVLDGGSGAGKFCAIASLDLGQKVFGVERRESLVLEARRLATSLGAEVEITHGRLDDVDAARFDGFYFFNPFGEYVADEEDRYDAEAPRSFEQYVRDARLVEGWLRAAPVGTAMVTYNGLGGRIPVSFRPKETTHVRSDTMRLWVKEAFDTSHEAFIEIEEELITASELAALARSGELEDNPLVLELSTYKAV